MSSAISQEERVLILTPRKRDADIASELLRKIKAAQYVAAHPGEVCPAKWKEGEATLAPSLDLVGKI